MADRSENPADQARMDRLASRLEGLESELSRDLAEARRLEQQTRSDAARARTDRTTAARETRARQGRVGAGGQAAEEQPRAIRDVTRELDDRRFAETRLEEAIRRRRVATERAAVQDSRRGLTFPRGADPGYQRILLETEQAKRAFLDAATARQRFFAPPPRQLGPGPPTGLPPANDPKLLTQYAESLRRSPNILGTPATGPRRLFTAGTGGLPGPVGGAPYTGAPRPGDLRAALAGTQALSDADQRLLQQALAAEGGTRKLAGALQEQTRALGLSDNSYTRHGYLTSEFISAAARGQVTFRELGVQVGGTIAKFAGWTAAASAVYGALAAVNALGRGALQSASGVGLLNRVTTQELPGGSDALQQRFRDLARKFNLPIEDVVQASYGSAKAFSGDLPQALKATEQALFAVKVGELSAADSTLYLNAIVKGFRLTADELPAVFDSINQAQNRFGGSTGDLIAGVAKAGGIFRLAGGDYRSLIALLTTGSRLTGASAKEVSTAIARSASRVLTPQGQDALAAQGLDPKQGYLQILAQASSKAQGASASEVNTLARALVPQGGQFARILAPILQNRGLYDRVFKEISPDKAQGSAARELANALSQPNEKLKQIVTNLEAMGAALGQAGALNLLVGVVEGLNSILGLTIDVIDQFESLSRVIPQPFRGAIAPALELLALLKLFRRFDVGSSLPAGSNPAYQRFRSGLQRDPDKAANAQILLGTQDERKFLEEERRRTALRASQATYQAERAELRRNAAQATFVNAPASGRVAAQSALIAAERDYQARVAAAAILVQDQTDIAARIATLQGQIAVYEREKMAGLSAEAAALKSGIFYGPGTLARPSPTQPVALGGAATASDKSAAYLGGGSGAGTQTAAAAKRTAYLTTQAQDAARAEGRLATAMASLGVTGTALASGASAAKAAAVTGLSGLRAAAVGIVGLAAALGPLELILAGALGIPLLVDAANKLHESQKTAADKIRDIEGGPEGIRRNAKRLESRGSVFAQVGDQFKSAGQSIGDLASGHIGRAFAQEDPHYAREQAANAARDLADRLEREQAGGNLLSIGDIRGRLSDKLTKTRDRAGRLALYDQALEQLEGDYIANSERVFGVKQGAGGRRIQAQAIADIRRRRAAELQRQAELTGDPSTLDLEGLASYQQGTEARFSYQGNTSANVERLRGTTNRLIQLARTARDDKSIEQVAKLLAGQHDQAQKIVDQYIASHPGLDEAVARRRGLRIATSALNLTGLKSRARAVRADVEHLAAGIKSQEAALRSAAAEQRTVAAGREQTGGVPRIDPSGALARLNADKAKLRQARGLMRVLERAIRGLFLGLRDAQQQFQDAQAHYDAETALLSAQAGGGLPSDRVTAGRNAARLKTIARHYGSNSTEYLNAQADLINQRNSITDQERSLAEENARKQQEAADKARQAAEEARQRAKDLISAQADYATSRTSDPIKQARIAYQEAIRLAKYAQGPAESLEARAEINNRRRDLLHAGQQSKYDDIEFYASIGKLTKDAELAQLQGLLKRIKDNKDLRRQIRQKIYELKHDASQSGDLELNLSDFKFPTVYEIRRATLGARQGTNVTQHYNTSIQVSRDVDLDQLGAHVDRIHHGTNRALQRAAGLR